MSITTTPRWSLGRGKSVVPSSWYATVQVQRAFAAAAEKKGVSASTASTPP